MKVSFPIILLCFSLLLTGCNSANKNVASKDSFLLGNTPGNILNGGYITQDNEWLYYTNFADDARLYKQKKDGSQKEQITKQHFAYELNLVGNDIYYISGAPGEVFKVDLNGNENVRIINQKAENLVVTNQYIFYRLAEDTDWGKLYRTDLNGENKKLLANFAIDFVLDDHWIYFVNGEDDRTLYKMDIEGENTTKIAEESAWCIDINNEFVFFTDENGSLHRIDVQSGENTLLTSDDCREINVSNDYLYYTNYSHGGRIYRMKLDGSENELVIDKEICTNLNVTESCIIYRIPQSNGGYFKSSLDGSVEEKF